MRWIEELQYEIDYMEKHLMDNIRYEEVARKMNVSKYYFLRTFSMVTGITPSEYLKSRRLSLAGQEIMNTKEKIIDIALKYGYDSPESFNRAFVRFHGVTPSVARKTHATLKLFNPLILKIKVEGGFAMEYRIVERERFEVLVKAREFDNESALDNEGRDIPSFWQSCHEDGSVAFLKGIAADDDMYGVCAPISDESDCFEYGIGVILKEGEKVPDGYKMMTIRPTKWAVFTCRGNNGDCISEVWDKIVTEFLPCSGYTRLDDVDFEVYPWSGAVEGVFCEIWLPIKNN